MLPKQISQAKKFVNTNRLEVLGLVFIFVITVFLRFYQLGYSHLYGDETKTIYWDKRVPATQFLLNQRKGPVQFSAVWFMEKVSGGYDEAAVRFPFALASTLSVFVIYVLLRRRYGYLPAFFGATLFSISGFSVAFGRTAQYQSFLVLFGLLAILFADVLENEKWTLPLSGTFLALSFLSHYDALFFAVPTIYILVQRHKKEFRKLIPFFAPLILLSAVFYLPYLLGGYFEEHTRGYINRRLYEFRKESSLLTFYVYNPSYLWGIFLAVGLLGFTSLKKRDKSLYLAWFLIPFVIFEIVFASPGTHIHNYVLPTIILFALGVSYNRAIRWISSIALVGVLFVGIQTFIPAYNNEYPWNSLAEIKKEYQIFLYGFPYNRGWEDISNYLDSKGVRSFYTNDNVTIGEYYLLGVPAESHRPHYYVSIGDNQEFSPLQSTETLDYVELSGFSNAHREYELVKEFVVDGKNIANVYKRVDPSK